VYLTSRKNTWGHWSLERAVHGEQLARDWKESLENKNRLIHDAKRAVIFNI